MQRIATCLMLVGDQYGRAEEAMRLYVSLSGVSVQYEVRLATDRFGVSWQLNLATGGF